MDHVPATSHVGVDRLSWWRCTPEDSDKEDAEELLLFCFFVNELFVFRFIAFLPFYISQQQFSWGSFVNHVLYSSGSFCFIEITSITEDLSILQTVDPVPAWAAELRWMRESNFDYAEKDFSTGSLVKHSLLSITDKFSYTGWEFEHRQVNVPELVICELGREIFMIEIQWYSHVFMSSLKYAALQPTIFDHCQIFIVSSFSYY